MRSYCSLYVDAGYLIAAASTRVTGTSLRSAAEVDIPGLVLDLTAQVEADSGLPLLRIHWYDAGTRTGAPSGNQKDIAALPKVKVRLGRVGFNGEQKGVDLKLALDLITQSRNKAAEIVYLVSGDDDLSEAVEEAQHQGVQVISLVVPGADGQPFGVSQHLQMTVDQMQLIHATSIDARVRKSVAASMKDVATAAAVPEAEPQVAVQRQPATMPSPLDLARSRPAAVPAGPAKPVPAYTTSTGTHHAPHGVDHDVDDAIRDVVDKVVMNWWRGASELTRAELHRAKPMIPSELDRALLNDLSNKLSVYDIPQDWRFALRDAFWSKVARL